MKTYVVYWVDLDNDCLKKSEIKILGVYDNITDAKKLAEDYYHDGYCEDSRCYYTNVVEVELNQMTDETKDYFKDRDEEYLSI